LNGCLFIGNSVRSAGNPQGNEAYGGGVSCTEAAFIDCLFIDNSATATGGQPIDRRAEGGAAAIGTGTAFIGCTMAGSFATTSGAAIYMRSAGISTIDNSIIAFSTGGGAMSCASGGMPHFFCSDVFGNQGGDWLGCIAGQEGIHGNFSSDPLFCDPMNENFTLNPDSPCAPEHSPGKCGLVGAQPVSCGLVGVAMGEMSTSGTPVRVVPNPVRTGTMVHWENSRPGPRRITLYDPLGRLVLRQELGFRAGGRDAVPWSDLVAGRDLPSGIYFLCLEPRDGAERAIRIVLTR
jgi:hypothetical protein